MTMGFGFCANCGTPRLAADQKFCAKCGSGLAPTAPPAPAPVAPPAPPAPVEVAPAPPTPVLAAAAAAPAPEVEAAIPAPPASDSAAVEAPAAPPPWASTAVAPPPPPPAWPGPAAPGQGATPPAAPPAWSPPPAPPAYQAPTYQAAPAAPGAPVPARAGFKLSPKILLIGVVVLAVIAGGFYYMSMSSSSGGLTFSPSTVSCSKPVAFTTTVHLPASVKTGDKVTITLDGKTVTSSTVSDVSDIVQQSDGSWTSVSTTSVSDMQAMCAAGGVSGGFNILTPGTHTMQVLDSTGAKVLASGSYTVTP